MKNLTFPDPKEVPVKGRLRVCLALVKNQNLKEKTLIDVGCSYGWLEVLLKEAGFKSMIGIDPERKAIEHAKKIAPHASFFVSTADKLPVKDNVGDCLTMFDVIEHVSQGTELEALGEAYRVLKTNGKIFLSTPNSNLFTNFLDPAWYLGHRHYRKGQIKKMLTKAGFTVEEISIKGGLWFSVYLIWLYINKWIFGNKMPRSKFLEEMDDQQFNKLGVHTIFVMAKKS